jgi:hypothetical protein
MIKGRIRQSQLGSEIDRLLESEGVVTQDTALSKFPDPTREAGQIRRPDFLWPDQKGGFTAVSSKDRTFMPNMSAEEVRHVVMDDIRAALEDYWGVRYVRSKSHSMVGEPIRINEVVVNYVGVPESMRSDMQDIAAAYSGVDVKIGFFEF